MLALAPLLSTAFSPAGDNGFTRLTVELAPGASLEDTLAVAETARKRLDPLPEVRSVYTTVGAQGGGGNRGPTSGGGSAGNVRRGTLVIQLDNPDGTRGAQQAFERKATEMLRDIPGRALPVRRRRRQLARGHAGRRRAESAEPRRGERRARDSRAARASA